MRLVLLALAAWLVLPPLVFVPWLACAGRRLVRRKVFGRGEFRSAA